MNIYISTAQVNIAEYIYVINIYNIYIYYHKLFSYVYLNSLFLMNHILQVKLHDIKIIQFNQVPYYTKSILVKATSSKFIFIYEF